MGLAANSGEYMGLRRTVSRGLGAVLVCLCLVGMPTRGMAHPHVFATNIATFEFDAKGVKGIRLLWHFDEMFGSLLLEDYDADGDGAFSPAEQKVLKSEAFDNLKNFGYFSHLSIGGQPHKVTDVQDFTAGVDGAEVFYSFVIPCRVAPGTDISLAVFDPEYYVDFYTPEGAAVRLENADAYSVTSKVAPNADISFSTWLITPTEISLRFTR